MNPVLTQLLWTVGTVVVLLVVLGSIGRSRERRHLAELDEREAALSVPVVDTQSPPPNLRAVHAEFVSGNVVIGTDYLKQFAASLRTLVGGEIRSFQTVISRARRESMLRMLENATERGARAVVNVRQETSIVIGGASEVLTYGTLLR